MVEAVPAEAAQAVGAVPEAAVHLAVVVQAAVHLAAAVHHVVLVAVHHVVLVVHPVDLAAAVQGVADR